MRIRPALMAARAFFFLGLGAAPGCLAAEGPRLHGTLTPPDGVQKIVLLDRDVPQAPVEKEVRLREIPVTFDAKTGNFTARGVAAGKSYDLYVELKDGARLEGVDLRPRVADETTLPPDGRAAIERHFYGMKQFYNENRVLALCGNDKSAAALVELCRTTEFYSGRGEVVWRIERWDYANEWGAWQPRGTRVFRRYRWNRAQWEGVRWYFVPAWGGLTANVEPLKLTMPDLAQTPGRYPGVARPAPASSPEPPAKKKHEEDLQSQKDPDLLPPKE